MPNFPGWAFFKVIVTEWLYSQMYSCFTVQPMEREIWQGDPEAFGGICETNLWLVSQESHVKNPLFNVLCSVVKKAFLKAGLVDLWKWRVWVQQKEEALLKVETNSTYGKATDIRRQATFAVISVKRFCPRAPTLPLRSLQLLQRWHWMTYRWKWNRIQYSLPSSRMRPHLCHWSHD